MVIVSLEMASTNHHHRPVWAHPWVIVFLICLCVFLPPSVVRSYYYGDKTPEADPEYYLSLLTALHQHFIEGVRSSDPSIPLVINTCGWVKSTSPTHTLTHHTSHTLWHHTSHPHRHGRPVVPRHCTSSHAHTHRQNFIISKNQYS